MSAAVAAFTRKLQADSALSESQTTQDIPEEAIARTHAALFDLWFPQAEINIPDSIRPDIGQIAQEVSAGMLEAFRNSVLLDVLKAMTVPQAFPFYSCLSSASNPAIQEFIHTSGGFGAMAPQYRSQVFNYFFEGRCGEASTQTAMVLREAYLSGIWDLPLALPLAEFSPPQTFVNRPDIYARRNAPQLPPSRLYYDSAQKIIRHKDGPIDYLVIGSGPGGATVAHQLREAGKRVVLLEKGPFVVWGSMTTRSYPRLMYNGDRATSTDNGIIIRSGETVGGGSAVNIDLAFSPLEATIQARIRNWIDQGYVLPQHFSTDRIANAYQWVREKIQTRTLDESEINRNNRTLWDGAASYGIDPSLYHLNRFPVGGSPSPVNDKRDAAKQLLLEAIENPGNPLSIIPDATVDEILLSSDSSSGARAIGIRFHSTSPWTEYGNTLVDPCGLHLEPNVPVNIEAENMVLSGGAIGSTRVLLKSAQTNPILDNPETGRGLVLHPSLPLLGLFDNLVNLSEGLDSSVYVDSFGVSPGFLFEAMSGLPAYGSLLVPGSGKQVYEQLIQYNNYAGFGCMLVDTPSRDNRIVLDSQGNTAIQYKLSESDKERFRIGTAIAVRMMFRAGAKQVVVPSNENLLEVPHFSPMQGTYLTQIDQADLVERNLKFIPNRTVLTSAHLQATNKMGRAEDGAVVSRNQRVYTKEGREIPNLYVMDCSIFPTSVGANPMQAIYTFAKIFSERLIQGIP